MQRHYRTFHQSTQDQERRELVERMVKTLGQDAAIRVCRNSFWYGLAEEIRAIPTGKPLAI
jgi:hypothetical protein